MMFVDIHNKYLGLTLITLQNIQKWNWLIFLFFDLTVRNIKPSMQSINKLKCPRGIHAFSIQVDITPFTKQGGVCMCLQDYDPFFNFNSDFWATKSDPDAIKVCVETFWPTLQAPKILDPYSAAFRPISAYYSPLPSEKSPLFDPWDFLTHTEKSKKFSFSRFFQKLRK